MNLNENKALDAVRDDLDARLATSTVSPLIRAMLLETAEAAARVAIKAVGDELEEQAGLDAKDRARKIAEDYESVPCPMGGFNDYGREDLVDVAYRGILSTVVAVQ